MSPPIETPRFASPPPSDSRAPAPFPRKVVAILAVGLVLTTLAISYELGAQSAGTSPTASPGSVVDYVNLTVEINATNGAPQYVPANFTVHPGLVAITITDHDDVADWPGCSCNVTGTVGGVEWLNGTAYRTMPSSNVAHTFTIASLGLNVLSPGGQTVFFEADLPAGTYTWVCMAPCGANGYTGFPMGTPGWMQGTLTVR